MGKGSHIIWKSLKWMKHTAHTKVFGIEEVVCRGGDQWTWLDVEDSKVSCCGILHTLFLSLGLYIFFRPPSPSFCHSRWLSGKKRRKKEREGHDDNGDGDDFKSQNRCSGRRRGMMKRVIRISFSFSFFFFSKIFFSMYIFSPIPLFFSFYSISHCIGF